MPVAKLEITADAQKALGEVAKVDTALSRVAATGDEAGRKVGWGLKRIEEGADKAGRAAVKMRGFLSALSPEAAALAGAVDDTADAFEALQISGGAAGVGLGAVGGAVAIAAAEALIAVGVFKSLTEEQDRNAASAALLEEAQAKIAPLLAKQRDAAISLRVARGELTEGEAAALRVGADAQAQLQGALKGTNDEIARLRDVQGSFTAVLGDAAATVREYSPLFNPLAYAVDGFTVSTGEAEAQVLRLQAGQASIIASTKGAVAVTNEAAAATDKHKAAVSGAADAQRLAAEQARAVVAEYEELRKAADAYSAGLIKLALVGRTASESNLQGVAREEAARAAALEALKAQYVDQATLARGNFDALADVDATYFQAREQLVAASEERIAALRATTAEEMQAAIDDALEATRAAEEEKRALVVGTLQSAAGVASQLFDLGVGYQTDLLRAMQADLAANEENLTDTQKKELQKRIDAQREAARRAFDIAKAAKIAEAIAATALAVINAIAQSPPPSPFGLIGAGVAAAAGAISVAQIAAQEPSFHVGVSQVRRPSQAPDEVRATLLEGEAVLSRRAVADVGRTNIEAMNAGRREATGRRSTVAPVQYMHKVYNEFIRDNIASGGPLADAIGEGKRVGHRQRSYS